MIRLRALGQCVIEVKRKPVRPDSEVVFAVLLHLCAERGRHIERDVLAELLWPRESATRRRHSLRQILYKVRRLGVDCGDAADSLMLPADSVWLDFEDAVRDDKAHAAPELLSPSGVQCLPGYAPRFSKRYSLWLDELRTRVDGAARRRLVAAVLRARQAGRWSEVETLARNCLKLDPLNEEATLALAEATALTGAKTRAVAMLDAYVAELGADAGDMKVPATILRRRIADRMSGRRPRGPLETQLIGREEIMGELTVALDRAKSGQPAVHALWGASGIGKTRILEELARVAALKGIAVASQRAASDDVHTPGFTFVRLLRTMLAMPGVLGLAPEILAFLQRLTAQRPSTQPPHQDEVSEDALVQAFADLERAVAWESPLVVMLDDLQYADALSRRVIGRAHGCLSTERVLLLVAGIPDPSSNGLGRLTAHEIRRLDHRAAVQLAGVLLEAHGLAADESVREACAVASGGHPFVLREAVAAQAHRGSLEPHLSLESTLQQRFNALSEDARDVLLSALILGEHATVPILVRSADAPAKHIENALAELEHERILAFSADGGAVAHSLWRSAIDQLFPVSRLTARRLHLARVLEQSSLGSAAGAELLIASGMLFQQAGEPAHAASTLARGGGELADRFLAPAAFSAFSRAADLAPAADDFHARLFHAIVSAKRAQLAGEAIKLLDAFGSELRTSERLGQTERAEVAIVDVEARQQLSDARAVLIADCKQLSGNHALSIRHRLRAAVAGVRLAEYGGDLTSVQAIAKSVLDCAIADSEAGEMARQISLVHEVASRNLARACEIAESIMDYALGMRPSPDSYLPMLSARIPFLFDCNFTRVAAILAEARDAVQPYPSSLGALRVGDAQATLYIELMMVDEAASLISALETVARQYAHAPISRSLRETQLRLRIARRDRDLAEQITPSLLTPNPDAPYARDRTFLLSGAAIGLARAGEAERLSDIVHELSALWTHSQQACPFDYPCVALAIGLGSLGRKREGDAVVAAYMRGSRVASFPPAPFVQSLADEFGVRLI